MMNKSLTIITGARAIGKTYKAIDICGMRTINGDNVFIISQTKHSINYFETILKAEYPYLNIAKGENRIFMGVHGKYMHSVSIENYAKHYEKLSYVNTLFIDDFETLRYLVRDNNFISLIENIDSVLITIQNYYLKKAASDVDECIRKLGYRKIIKVNLDG